MAVPERVVEWQVPRYESSGTRIKGWCDELTQNGDRWVRGLRSFEHIDDDVRVLMGSAQKGTVHSNNLQTDIRTFVETISDLRQIATFGSKAEQFKENVETYNGVTSYIYSDSGFVRSTRKAMQYAMLGRGYLWMRYTRGDYGWGKGHIQFDALGPLEVLPEQLPADNDIGGAYANTIIRPMPIAEAHARFPKFQDRINTISRYDWKAYGTLSMAKRLEFYDRWRFGEEQSDWDNRYTEMRYHFLRDLRINMTGRRLRFGADGAPWAYEVPSVGEMVYGVNPINGLPESHKATVEECRMYPQLRLIITNPTVNEPLYDGTAFDWHGKMPLAEYDVNDWAWAPMGYSLIRTVSSLERARRRLVSGMEDVAEVNLDPPLGYDMHAGVSRAQLEKFDVLKGQGYRVGVAGDPEKALRSLLPSGMKLEGDQFKQLESIGGMIKAQLGLTDIASLRELKMNLASESFDKFVENLGPIAKGITQNIGFANGKIAEMLKYSIPQYFTIAQILSYIGPSGASMQTFDYDPQSLVPSHLPGEDTDHTSRWQKRERAHWFAEQLQVTSVPTQLLNVTQQQERMMYMFFLQKGVPIPMSVIMEKLGVQNYGTVEGDTLFEKWKNEQIANEMLKLKIQVMIAAEMKKLGIEPPQDQQQHPGQGKGGGRPNSGKNPPKLESRGGASGNQRTLISTSK